MRSADSSKNRVWTLSLWKLGQVYLRRSVNWVIVGVNYIISHQQRFLWCQKKLQAGYLWQSDWCDNMPIRSYKYVPVLPVNMSRPYFSTRPQATREKFGVWDETKWDLARTLNHNGHTFRSVLYPETIGYVPLQDQAYSYILNQQETGNWASDCDGVVSCCCMG